MEDNKNKKVPNVPTLRFPEFNKNGAWTHKKIFDMGEIVTGTTPSTKIKEYYSNGKYLWVTPTDICGKEITTTNQKLTELGLKKGRKIQKNSILVTCVASIGKNCILREAGSCNQQINAIAVNNIHNIDFVYYLMENSVSMLHKYSSKGGMEILNKDVFSNLIVYTPNIEEQSKIANFLSLIDKIIELQNKIIRDYKLLKKGIQNYFFKNINSDNSYSLSCFLEEYTLKNLKNNLQVVSVGKYGIRQRNEIYSKVLSDDLSKNKVIFQDTLTIGMGTKQIDFGILSKNVEYCVSPAYRTYKIKNINSEYLKYYLEIINNQLSRKYMIISARQGTTIDNKSFLKHQLVVHPILKQNYIVNVINIIRKYLTISDDILETHKDLKKYLLKHIFI